MDKGKKSENICVLHIDDSEDFLEITKLYLSKHYDHLLIEYMVNPSLKSIQSKLNSNSFDVIICDYEMPDLSGLQILKALRDQQNKIPFIIFTGRGREEVAIHALNLGANYYITKGSDIESQYRELIHAIKMVVKQKRTATSLKEREQKYRSLFEETPIAQAEKDYSIIKTRIDHLKTSGITDFKEYFDNHPEEVKNFASTIKLTDVNQAALTLFQTTSDQFASIPFVLMDQPRIFNDFKNLLILLAQNTYLQTTQTHVKISNIIQHIEVVIYVPKAFRHNFSSVWLKYLDKSDREQKQQELNESEEKYRLLFENVEEAILILDLDTKHFFDVNPAAEKLYGYPRKEFIKLHVNTLTAEPEKTAAVLNNIRKDESVITPQRKNRKKDGTIFTVEFKSKAIRYKNKNLLVSIVRDLSNKLDFETE